jgi:type I restriction enzyme, S subunit
MTLEPPANWLLVTLGEVCDKPQYGWTTKAKTDGHGLKLLRTTDITSGRVDWNSVPYCTEEPPDPDRYVVRAGDIVVTRAASVGASLLHDHIQPAFFATYIK